MKCGHIMVTDTVIPMSQLLSNGYTTGEFTLLSVHVKTYTMTY